MHPHKHIVYLKLNLFVHVYLLNCQVAKYHLKQGCSQLIILYILCILCILCIVYIVLSGCQISSKTRLPSIGGEDSAGDQYLPGKIFFLILLTHGKHHLSTTYVSPRNIFIITKIYGTSLTWTYMSSHEHWTHAILPPKKGLLCFKSSSTFRLEECIREN